MTDHLIPPQSGGGDAGTDPHGGRPPVHPSVSEAGRLLCAGTYLDAVYRDRVIDELFVHEERIAAPSYGFDATRVLAHALRARRIELGWAAGVIGAWFVGSLLTGWQLTLLLVPFLQLSLANWLGARRNRFVRTLGLVLRVYTWVWLVFIVLSVWTAMSGNFTAIAAFLDVFSFFSDDAAYAAANLARPGASGSLRGWLMPLVFAALVTVVGLQRGHAARIVLRELSPSRYADHAGDPAEASQSPRFARVRARIRREQHAPLVMYDINAPFTGAGEAFRPWQLSVELRPREDLGPGRKPQPVTNAHIVGRITPLLQALRVPSPHGSREAQEAVLDRLRELAVDECVFLPATGLPHRDAAPLSPEQFAEHRLGAVEEGGERRRHFLRIRVGGWDENLVVTVFVRVHTQGGMLMLEVAPHVLLPVRAGFQNADAAAQRLLNNNWLGKAADALAATPGSFAASVATLGRGYLSWSRIATGGHGGARPEGPGLSVRELAAMDDGSLFHLMDLDRYLKTIQDRVVGGVTVALHEAGWHTEEFARRAVTVAEGGVYIQSMNNSAASFGGSNNTNTIGTSGKGSSGGK
ncbi:hypothetical protein EF910_34515 [Streptomyces sp. WAC07149]|uniref:hypothetical protein n=1 Tax=Streptomyces sp. WAC07149 TaxID=2487425 RepID=UPI000F786EA2|nr:hypothetical protein [Streptomyces sp. WAC07149]RSS99697.1 hypothetical protein EF910_34515 [Streptomyces sp. WAC07149]